MLFENKFGENKQIFVIGLRTYRTTHKYTIFLIPLSIMGLMLILVQISLISTKISLKTPE